MAVYVLVHGAGHGGWCWRKVAPLLRAAGHEVHAPTLTGLGERVHLASPAVGLETHVQDVVNLLFYEDLRGIVLVGHSYGGMVVAGAADRARERLRHLVYLDAAVPENGQALFDLFDPSVRPAREAAARERGDGWRMPRDPAASLRNWGVDDPDDVAWLTAGLVGQPLKTFQDPIRLAACPDPTLGRTFVYCTRKPGPDSVAPIAARVRAEPGWFYHELPTGHDAMVTAPRELADLLLELA